MARRTKQLLSILVAFLLQPRNIICATDSLTTPSLRGEMTHQDERRRLREKELANGTRIVCRYRSRRGHRLATSCARKIILHDDNERNGMLIFEGNGDCMYRMQRDPDIVEADFDFPVRALGADNTLEKTIGRKLEEETVPWGIDMINAHQLAKGQHEISICVVDSGITVGHPNFLSHHINGEDSHVFYRENWKWDRDLLNHGTGVAGVLASVGNSDDGMQGSGFSFYVTRGVGDDGEGHEYDIRVAIKQCVRAGAHIINLSIGGGDMSSQASREYARVVEEMGVLMVAAAGNDGSNEPVYPAAHPSVISVSAVNPRGDLWWGSNYGNQIELAAPGQRILTAGVTTSMVEVQGQRVEGYQIAGAGTNTVAAKLVFCGNGDRTCPEAKGGICLVSRTNANFENMLSNCQGSEAVGAIIIEPTAGDDATTWRISQASGIRIPAMVVTWHTGMEIIGEMLGETVVVGSSGEVSQVEYTYETPSGTSFAAPNVAAAAALVWSHFGSACTNHQIRYALAVSAQARESASSSESHECNEAFGYGIVNAKGAYDWLMAHDCSTWDVPRVSRGGCTTLWEED